MKDINFNRRTKRAAAALICCAVTATAMSGCYLLPDEEEVLAAPTVKAS